MQELVNKPRRIKKIKIQRPTTQLLKLKKKSLEGINSIISEGEEWFSELEDKIVEITSEEQNKGKRMQRAEDSHREIWDHIKCTNIWTIGVPEE